MAPLFFALGWASLLIGHVNGACTHTLAPFLKLRIRCPRVYKQYIHVNTDYKSAPTCTFSLAHFILFLFLCFFFCFSFFTVFMAPYHCLRIINFFPGIVSSIVSHTALLPLLFISVFIK